MRLVMQYLNEPIPEWCLRRYMQVTHTEGSPPRLCVQTVDADRRPASILRAVHVRVLVLISLRVCIAV
jgi:hypothetical protein